MILHIVFCVDFAVVVWYHKPGFLSSESCLIVEGKDVNKCIK